MKKKKGTQTSGPIRAVVYARYSSHNQTEQSIEGQLRDVYGFAAREGYVISHEYIDRAQSATSDNRDAFQQMISDAKKREFSAVIVWKLDRFARNRYDSAFYKKMLADNGVTVVSAMERIEDTPEGIILEGLLESFAEYYSANLSVNVKRGMRESALKGKYVCGAAPYGYKVADGRLVPDETTAPIVRELFERYAAGDRRVDIVRDFRRRGITAPGGGLVMTTTYTKIIKNPIYVGRAYYRGELMPSCAEPIISEELFGRVQARIRRSTAAPGAWKAPEPYLLSGKLYCGECGGTMTGSCGGSKRVIRYYRCVNSTSEHLCTKKPEKADELEALVISSVISYVMDPGNLEYIAAKVCDAQEDDAHGREVSDLAAQITGLRRRVSNLVDTLSTAPASARPPILSQIESLSRQLEDAEAQQGRLEAMASRRITPDDVKAYVQDHLCADPCDTKQRRALVDAFVNSVQVYYDKVVIFFNLRPSDRDVRIPRKHDDGDGRDDDCIWMQTGDLLLPNTIAALCVFVHGLCGIAIKKD